MSHKPKMLSLKNLCELDSLIKILGFHVVNVNNY